MSSCVFCKIIAKEMDEELTVFEDENVIAQVSLHQKPNNKGHILVIPKQHHETIYDLPSSLDASMMSAIRSIARAVKKAFLADGIQIRQNNERAAGQDVFHLHFHVIPRFESDNFENEKYLLLPFEARLKIANQLKEIL